MGVELSDGVGMAPEVLRSDELGRLDTDFVVIGTNHRHAPLDVRERIEGDDSQARLVSIVGEHSVVREYLVLGTCNRVELWALAADVDGNLAVDLAEGLRVNPAIFYVRRGEEAIRHAIRVASGLDSQFWGEAQIAGQVREALEMATASGSSSRTLSDLVRRVSSAAGAVRVAAGVPSGRSASDAAVDLVLRRFPRGRPTVLIVGTGKMGRLAARRLASCADLAIADRDPGKARALAGIVGARSLDLSTAFAAIQDFDAAIVATSSRGAILAPQRLADSQRERTSPLLVIDLSVPRNVEPSAGHGPGIELVDLDGLPSGDSQKSDADTAARAETAIRAEASRISAWLRALPAEETIAWLRGRAEAIRREELASACRRLGTLSPTERAVLDKMAERIVNRLLHGPTEAIRSLASGGWDPEANRLVRRLLRVWEEP